MARAAVVGAGISGLTAGYRLQQSGWDVDVFEAGISKIVQFTQVTRSIPGALKSTHGTHRQIARLNRLIDPNDRVQLAGDYLGMPSVNGSIISGEKAAQRLSAALGNEVPAAGRDSRWSRRSTKTAGQPMAQTVSRCDSGFGRAAPADARRRRPMRRCSAHRTPGRRRTRRSRRCASRSPAAGTRC